MSEENESQETPKPTPPPAQEAAQKPEEVDTVDWKAEARKWEERAKKDRGAAAELAKIKEAQKTEAEKAADRLRQLESEANQARQEATRFKIAAKFKIADDYADFLTGDEESMIAQAKKLSKLAEDAGKPRAPKPDPNQGRVASSGTSTADQFAAAFNEAFNR